jgi:PKD repeat protein
MTLPITVVWSATGLDVVTRTVETRTDQIEMYWAEPGDKTITVEVINDGGMAVGEHDITIYPIALADFEASPRTGIAPATVVFTNTSVGAYSSSFWAFGDGQTSNLEHPTHVYAEPGSYTVTLTVSGDGGVDEENKAGYINVYLSAHADFEASPLRGTAPMTVTFRNTSVGDFSSSTWEFGDGQTSSLDQPSHIYTETGSYTVTLTIDGSDGSDQEKKVGYINVHDHQIFVPFVKR